MFGDGVDGEKSKRKLLIKFVIAMTFAGVAAKMTNILLVCTCAHI